MILPQRLLGYRSMNANHIYIGLWYSLVLAERLGSMRMFQFSKKFSNIGKYSIKIEKFILNLQEFKNKNGRNTTKCRH
jgi:hypothetical protein